MLNTDAIRKRFAEAIIGIRADGSMAVLVETEAHRLPMYPTLSDGVGKPVWYNIVDGVMYLLEQFPTLIRPGDRCEVLYEDGAWHAGTYCGYSSNSVYPFAVDNQMVARIHPLPEPVANPELEQARTRIENAERELSEARAALGRASK